MQLIIADWRLAIEHVPTRRAAAKRETISKVEREARRAHMLQQVENERRTMQDRQALSGARLQY